MSRMRQLTIPLCRNVNACLLKTCFPKSSVVPCYQGKSQAVSRLQCISVHSSTTETENHGSNNGSGHEITPHRPAQDQQTTFQQVQAPLEAGLYVVATPIGNLEDITLRALNVLKSVNLVLAEDTRHTRKLLNYYGIKTDIMSYHHHNEKSRESYILQRLKGGEALALVSDAGMPAISDPGHLLVSSVINAGLKVITMPGPCALISALVASGLPTQSFTFCGFLPPKQGARKSRLQQLSHLMSTLVFYAPPHGLKAILADMCECLGGQRRACVARELTKIHEEYWRSTLSEALQEFSNREPRGEICIVVEGWTQPAAAPAAPTAAAGSSKEGLHADASDPMAVIQQLLESGSSVSVAAKEAAQMLGMSKKEAYSLALRLAEQHKGAKQSTWAS